MCCLCLGKLVDILSYFISSSVHDDWRMVIVLMTEYCISWVYIFELSTCPIYLSHSTIPIEPVIAVATPKTCEYPICYSSCRRLRIANLLARRRDRVARRRCKGSTARAGETGLAGDS